MPKPTRQSYYRAWKERNPEKQREYFNRWMEGNREKRRSEMREYMRRYRARRSDETPDQMAKRRATRNLCERKKYQSNKEAARAKQRAKRAKRQVSSPSFRIANAVRCRIYTILKGRGRSGKTVALLGCDFRCLIAHLERQWTKGMSWLNYGNRADQWSIDHIKPCSAFDLLDPVEQQACFHYSNLRPCWHSENMSKGSRWNGKTHRYAN